MRSCDSSNSGDVRAPRSRPRARASGWRICSQAIRPRVSSSDIAGEMPGRGAMPRMSESRACRTLRATVAAMPSQPGDDRRRAQAFRLGRAEQQPDHQQHHRGDLPRRGVRKHAQRGRADAVDRREGRAAPLAGVDVGVEQRLDEGQRAVDVAAPLDPRADELLGVVRLQPHLALPVAHLLAPEGADRGAVVVPDQRRRGEADGAAGALQPPAHVHVVAGAQVDGVEAADGAERLAPHRHVAARDVLGDAIVEQHVGRAARSAGHALRQPRVVVGDDVGPAHGDHVRVEERLHQVGEPVAGRRARRRRCRRRFRRWRPPGRCCGPRSARGSAW